MDENRLRGRRLTVEDVAQIKAHLKQGERPATLARHFNVHQATIARIRDEKLWRSIKPAAKATPLSLSPSREP